jgi:hypothetical protein
MICEHDGAAKRSVRSDRGLIFFCYATVGRWRRFAQGIEFAFFPKAPDPWMSDCRIAPQPRKSKTDELSTLMQETLPKATRVGICRDLR